MTAWFDDGHAAAAILGIMLVEFLLLAVARRAALRALWPSLCAGGFLLLAWLAGTAHAPWFLVAGALLLAGCAHATDVARRL